MAAFFRRMIRWRAWSRASSCANTRCECQRTSRCGWDSRSRSA